MFTVTADSSANLRLLKELKAKGFIDFEFINLENAKEKHLKGMHGWSENRPAVAVFDVSTFADGDVFGSDQDVNIWENLKKILGGGKYNINDRRQLSNHYRSGNDIFVTGDRGDIVNNAAKLLELGIIVLHNDDLVEYIQKMKN